MTGESESIELERMGAAAARQQASAKTDVAKPKRRAWTGTIIAGLLTLLSMHFLLIHAAAGWWDPGEILLAGSGIAGYLLSLLFVWAGTRPPESLPFLCAACVGFLGWYSLTALIAEARVASSRNRKAFWILVAILTWMPALILAFLAIGGMPIGSSM